MNSKDKNLCRKCTQEYASTIEHVFDMLVLSENKCGVCRKKGRVLRFKKGYLNT